MYLIGRVSRKISTYVQFQAHIEKPQIGAVRKATLHCKKNFLQCKSMSYKLSMYSEGVHPSYFLKATYIACRLLNPDISDKASIVKDSYCFELSNSLK